VVAPATIHAECITVTADALMRQTTSKVIFSGTVVEVARTADLGYRATFDVERVWKGSVTRRFDLWVYELAPEIPRFEAGRRYVVAAHRMTGTRHRQGAGLGDSAAVVYTPAMCSDPPSLAKDIEQALGLGYLPQ
jgi:hypothetical protein